MEGPGASSVYLDTGRSVLIAISSIVSGGRPQTIPSQEAPQMGGRGRYGGLKKIKSTTSLVL